MLCRLGFAHITHCIIELLFVFVEAVFVAPRSEQLGIEIVVIFTRSNLMDSKGCQPFK